MPSKAPIEPVQPTSTISGKLLIIGIVTMALVAAIGSWKFRYATTHRVANFWQPENAALIRDAPEASFVTFTKPAQKKAEKVGLASLETYYSKLPQMKRDVTEARGLIHFRHALLQNHSFDWPHLSLFDRDRDWQKVEWTRAMVFSDPATGRNAYLLFAPESKLVTWADSNQAISYAPIGSGVDEMFTEFDSLPSIETEAR